jgi:hypothetical protein
VQSAGYYYYVEKAFFLLLLFLAGCLPVIYIYTEWRIFVSFSTVPNVIFPILSVFSWSFFSLLFFFSTAVVAVYVCYISSSSFHYILYIIFLSTLISLYLSIFLYYIIYGVWYNVLLSMSFFFLNIDCFFFLILHQCFFTCCFKFLRKLIAEVNCRLSVLVVYDETWK